MHVLPFLPFGILWSLSTQHVNKDHKIPKGKNGDICWWDGCGKACKLRAACFLLVVPNRSGTTSWVMILCLCLTLLPGTRCDMLKKHWVILTNQKTLAGGNPFYWWLSHLNSGSRPKFLWHSKEPLELCAPVSKWFDRFDEAIYWLTFQVNDIPTEKLSGNLPFLEK